MSSPNIVPRPQDAPKADIVNMQAFRPESKPVLVAETATNAHPYQKAQNATSNQAVKEGYSAVYKETAETGYKGTPLKEKSPVFLMILGAVLGGVLIIGAFLMLKPSSPEVTSVALPVVTPVTPLVAAITPSAPPKEEARVEVVAPPAPVVIAPEPTPVMVMPPVAIPAPVVVEPTPSPPAPVVVAPPPIAFANVPLLPTFSQSELNALMGRARTLLNDGDISTARAFLERAANAHYSPAMLALAETFDPNHLRKINARGVRADQKRAVALYEKALELGETSARAKLEALR